MTATVIYEGDLRTVATHLKSGTTIETDAPTDNQGKGERFSPTDLVSAALASCMMTIMGIAARSHNIQLEGTTCQVEKIMEANPRRIGAIKIEMRVKGQAQYDDKEKAIIEHAARTCPVALSLHPELKKEIQFIWP